MIKTTPNGYRVELREDKFCIIEYLDYVGKMGKKSCYSGLELLNPENAKRESHQSQK